MVPEENFKKIQNGYKIHYLDHGANDAVHHIIFIHGSGSGASGHSNFKYNYPFFVDHQCRVIVPDLIGYGLSDKPQDVDYHLNFFVECLYQLLQTLDVKNYILIGNSLGGAIAIRYALDYPQLVSGLILMAPGGIEQQASYFTMPGMQMMRQIFAENKTRQALGDFIRRGLVYEKNQALIDEALVDERWQIAQLQNARVIQTMQVPDMSAELKDLQCPVLGFWGIDEQMMPESGIMKLAKNIPRIKMVLLSQCGHWVMVEHKDVFNRYSLDFIKNSHSY